MTPFGTGGFRFEDRRQERIHDRLTRLVGPGAAAFYLDACRLMRTEPPLATTTHLVSHGIREIESSMRDVLETVAPRRAEKRKKCPGGDHRKEIIATLAALEIPEGDPVAQYWLNLPGRENSYGLHSRAHRAGLSSPRPLDTEFFEFWNAIQDVLDAVLDRFEARFAEVLRALESLLEKPLPSKSDAERLALHLPENAVFRSQFFARAGPEWFEPLRRAGLFGRIPSPIREGEEIRCSMWPASGYLARMASGLRPLQEAVLGVVRDVANTENFWAQEDFLDAALALSPDLSARLIPFIIGWLGSPFAFGLPEKAGKLVRHLAEGGEKAAALKLAREILSPVEAPATRRAAQEAAGLSSFRPTAKFDLYHYDNILKNALPALAHVAARETFEMLSDLLEQAIRLTGGAELKGYFDLSGLWRPAIEDHKQNALPSLESSLVSAVRDAAIQITKVDPAQLPWLIGDLERRGFVVFRRLALHLLRVNSAPLELINERLTDASSFEDSTLLPEYAFLLRDRFGQLPQGSQGQILDWIEAGPDVTNFAEWCQKQSGKRPADAYVERYVKRWQLGKLLLVRDAVPAEWRERCARLEAEFGLPSIPPEFTRWTESWVGPTSPKSKAELSTLSVEELLEYLRTWRPSDDWRSPSPEGLGRNLSELVAENPERFDSAAPRFRGVDATYVWALFSGFRSAAGKGRSLNWTGVLDLCEWAVEQPRPDAVSDQDSEPEPDWRSVRQEIGYLVQAGLDRNQAPGIPFNLRERVWHVLEPITNDPDPSPERDARSGADPAGLSLNSARAVAMRTVFSYAAWVHRNTQGSSKPTDVKIQGFDSMPEVRAVLDAHLDPIREPSLAIRSVYGEHFSQAVFLDPNWAKGSVGRIFPQPSDSRQLREAAWSSFLHFGRFTKPAFDLLRPDYARAIDELDLNDVREESMFSPGGRLAAHLMFLYWNGRLGLDDPEGLLPRFFEKASDRLRAEAVRFLSRELGGEELEISGDVQERVESFWSWRLDAARSASPSESHSEELASFGWWFSSKKLPSAWALGQVIEVLRMAGKIDPHHLVMERLADLGREMPGETLECLTLLLDSDGRASGLIGGRQEAKAVLSAAIDAGDGRTRKRAIELANRLISKGHLEFRDVIPSDPG